MLFLGTIPLRLIKVSYAFKLCLGLKIDAWDPWEITIKSKQNKRIENDAEENKILLTINKIIPIYI